jgi:hypothetical protein
MRRLLLLLPFLLVACSPFGRRGGAIRASDLVVCVRNDLAAYGNVTARAAEATFDVMPGATSCRRIIAGDPRIALTATTIGGGAAGPLSFSDALPSSGPGCWLWRLGPGRTAAILPMECSEVPGLTGSNPPAPGRPELASSSL